MTEAISQYLEPTVARKNGEIATLPLVARNDGVRGRFMPMGVPPAHGILLRKPPVGSLRRSGATEAISQYLGRVITKKNGEIATLPLVARNDELGYWSRPVDFHAHGCSAAGVFTRTVARSCIGALEDGLDVPDLSGVLGDGAVAGEFPGAGYVEDRLACPACGVFESLSDLSLGEGGGEGISTTYTYNADRQLTQVTRPDGQTLLLGYDTGGRLSTLGTPTGTLQYTYSPTTGTLASIAAPGSMLSYTYDGSLLKTTT